MPADSLAALQAVGWTDRVAALVTSCDVPGSPGRVARADRGQALVVTAEGPAAVSTSDRSVATGDWVVVSGQRLEAVLPRWSVLRRGGGDTRAEQVLAANVDIVAIAMGLDRPFNPRRLERLVTLAWDAAATPVVVLTKADRAGGLDDVVQLVQNAAPGCDVVVTSAVTGAGTDELRKVIPAGRTMVLIGESGAGKSSLINCLIGNDLLETGAVRRGDAKGRHTTTARELVPLPGGGVLLDTPGLRAVGLPTGAGDALDTTFTDVATIARGCRFTDCLHATEPGCAVLAAVEDGELPEQRLAAYRKLAREIASEERRADERVRRAQERSFGRQAREVMEFKRRTR